MKKKHLIIAGIVFAIAIIAGGIWIHSQKAGSPMLPTEPSIADAGKCGDGICGDKEKANPELCPEDCGDSSGEQLVEFVKSCSEQNGNICNSSQACSGAWITASDSEMCCGGKCEITSGKRKINIVFDVHSHEDFITEVVSGSPNPEIRRQAFQAQLDDLEWLLEITRKYGADISFLSVGPWAEMCAEGKDKERCLSLVNQLYESGGIIGSHSHEYRSTGQFNEWEKLLPFQMTGVEQKEYLEENIDSVNKMIKKALGLSNPSEISAVNLAYGSPEPRGITNDEKYDWLSGLGFKMKEGGEEQQMLPYFHQVPYNPFRPGEFVLEENFNGKLITIPQYPIFDTGKHFGVEIDASAEHLKAMFLQLYLNWETSEDDLVWVFSVGSHLHDWDPNDVENRQCLDEMLGWLQGKFVDKGIAEFSNYREVMEEFEEWESVNAGVSSFHYPLEYADYDYYPYLEWVNRYLKNSLVKNKIQTEQEVNAYLMESGNYQFVLSFTDKTSASLDLSEYFSSSSIRRVFLETGEFDLIDPSSISLDQRAVIFCNSDECEAILNSGIDQTAPTNQTTSTDSCGDGICGPVEKEKGICPEDCE